VRTFKLCLIFILLSLNAFAVTTRKFSETTQSDFSSGTLKNVVISSTGAIYPGHDTETFPGLGKAVWSSVVDAKGRVVFSTGSPAAVYRIEGGKPDKIFSPEDVLALSCLAVDGTGNIFAASMSGGKIFKITPDGKSEVFCALKVSYIWCLGTDKQNNLYAGTGTEGQIFRIGKDGKAEVYYDTPETNILSMAVTPDGTVYAGGSEKGFLFRVEGKGNAVLVHNFREKEVKSIFLKGDEVYIGVNDSTEIRPENPAGKVTDLMEMMKKITDKAEEPQAPPVVPPLSLPVLRGRVYVRHGNGNIEQVFSPPDQYILDVKVDRSGMVLIATGNKGRVYGVKPSEANYILFDLEPSQVLTLAMQADELCFMGTGNAGTGVLVRGSLAKEGSYISRVFDAGFVSTWGKIKWDADGKIGFSTRSGNTSEANETWSDWVKVSGDSPADIKSPAARFLQYRAVWSGQSTLKSVDLFYLNTNQRPAIDSITVGREISPKPRPDKTEAGKNPADDAASMVSDVMSLVKKDKKAFHSTVKEISWSASDPDSDELVYRIFFKGKDEMNWIELTGEKPLGSAGFSWNTESVPDGYYEVKVVASDSKANPEGQELAFEKISDPFLVDNTKPEIKELKVDAGAKTVTGRAVDNFSEITKLEYSIDSNYWKFFYPVDGLFDDKNKEFKIDLPDLPAGKHRIAVMATDSDCNAGVGKTVFEVK